MADLTTADVEEFTGGRLADGDEQVQAMLDAALVRARRYARWHVSPARDDESFVLDGPAESVLQLPTRKLLEISALAENGTALNVSALEWSETGRIRKPNGGCWTHRYSGISATVTHGYTEVEAADWRRAVLSMVDQMSRLQQSGRTDAELRRKRVDDVEYEWLDYGALADQALSSVTAVFDDYALLPVMFR